MSGMDVLECSWHRTLMGMSELMPSRSPKFTEERPDIFEVGPLGGDAEAGPTPSGFANAYHRHGALGKGAGFGQGCMPWASDAQ